MRKIAGNKHWGGLFIIIPCMPKRKINSSQLLKDKQDRANLQKPIGGK
jgi:ssDNA-specific exonuclease RecJ